MNTMGIKFVAWLKVRRVREIEREKKVNGNANLIEIIFLLELAARILFTATGAIVGLSVTARRSSDQLRVATNRPGAGAPSVKDHR